MRIRPAVTVLIALLGAGCGSGAPLRIETASLPGATPRPAVSPAAPASTTNPPAPTTTTTPPAILSATATGPVRPATTPPAAEIAHQITSGPIAGIAYAQGALWAVAQHAHAATLLRIDAASGRFTSQTAIPNVIPAASTLAVGVDGVWLAEPSGVWRVDAPTGAVVAAIPLASRPRRLLMAGPQLWVLATRPPATGLLVRIDPATARIGLIVPVAPNPVAVTTFAGSVWVADASRHRVYRLDETTGRQIASVGLRAAGGQPIELTAYRGLVWVFLGDAVASIDPATNRIGRVVRLAGHAGGTFAAGAGAIWILTNNRSGGDELIRLDPASGKLSPGVLALPGAATAIATGAGMVWIAQTRPPAVLGAAPSK